VSAPEERALRLVPGGADEPALPPRSVRRRAANRRRTLHGGSVPRRRDPITSALEHLDEEPVVEPLDAVQEPEEAEETEKAEEKPRPPKPRRTVRRREPEPRRARWRRPRLATVLLAVVLCAVLAAAGVFGSRWNGDRRLERAHQQALAAAKQTTVDFVSVSAGSVDRDLQRIVAGATGDFREEFTRGQAQVRAAIVENNVDSRGTVLRAALVSGDLDSAVVLVAVDATVRNAKAPEGRASHYRIQVDMAHDGGSGRWLVAKLQFVG
jgi:Mce-associated membrane protein